MLYYIDIKYACFGIKAKNDIVVEAPPIAKWAIGKDIDFVLEYYKFRKKAKITALDI
jgi:hypothetical protein